MNDNAIAMELRRLGDEQEQLEARLESTERRLEAVTESHASIVCTGFAFIGAYIVSDWWRWPGWASTVTFFVVFLTIRMAMDKELGKDRFRPWKRRQPS
jgi:hypothetical protein